MFGRKPWRQQQEEAVLRHKKPPPQWQRDPSGAIPVTPKQRRRIKLGTARLKASRGSERMHRLLRSAFLAVLEMLGVILAATLFGRFMYELYRGASVGRAIIQAVIGTVALCVWLVFTRERYKADTRRAIAQERGLELAADQGARTDTQVISDRTVRMDRVGQAGPPPPDNTIEPEGTGHRWPPRRDGEPQGFVDPDKLPEEPL
jgi:hypothetical protein